MKSRYALLAVGVWMLPAGITSGSPAARTPSAPSQSSSQSRHSENDNNNSPRRSSSRNSPNNKQNNNGYSNGFPYNPYTGYPYVGIYSPGMTGANQPGSSSSSSSNDMAPSAAAPPLFQPDPSAMPAPAPAVAPPTPAPAPDPELVAATAAWDEVVGQVKKSLRINPDYMSALLVKQEAKDDAAALRAKGENSAGGDIVAIAQRGLEAGKKMAAIEREAMAKDPTAIAARARLDAAVAAHKAAK